MNPPARVLLLGHDEAKLESMAVVLRHFWTIETTFVSRLTDPVDEADLTVICDSIEEPKRQQFVEMLRAQSPLQLIVKLNGYDSGPHASADATVDTIHGPGALVSTIYELLTERGLGTREWPTPVEAAWLH